MWNYINLYAQIYIAYTMQIATKTHKDYHANRALIASKTIKTQLTLKKITKSFVLLKIYLYIYTQ